LGCHRLILSVLPRVVAGYFASLMIAAGVNAKALSTYMSYASVTITFDRYGHLMPGSENEAASLLGALLARVCDANTPASSRGSWLGL
jgi:hypothetical protein